MTSPQSLHPANIRDLAQQVTRLDNGNYSVPSQSVSLVFHEVKQEPDGDLSCGCSGYFYRGYCAHTFAVRLYLDVKDHKARFPRSKVKLEDLFPE